MPVMWFSAFDVVLTTDVCENAENLWPFSPYLIWILMWFVIFQVLQSIPKLKSKSLLSVLSVMLAIFAAWLFSSVDLGYAFSWLSVLDYKNSTVIGLALFALLFVGAAFYVDYKTSNNKFIPLIMTLLLIGTLWKVYFFVTFAALLLSGCGHPHFPQFSCPARQYGKSFAVYAVVVCYQNFHMYLCKNH